MYIFDEASGIDTLISDYNDGDESATIEVWRQIYAVIDAADIPKPRKELFKSKIADVGNALTAKYPNRQQQIRAIAYAASGGKKNRGGQHSDSKRDVAIYLFMAEKIDAGASILSAAEMARDAQATVFPKLDVSLDVEGFERVYRSVKDEIDNAKADF